ncbi:MAG: hypothetical protein MUF48_09015 [Pirellulaceae bacterium]|nr:hypothetical protein [Pirellulaceae bacterium]
MTSPQRRHAEVRGNQTILARSTPWILACLTAVMCTTDSRLLSAALPTQVICLDGDDWRVAQDPRNVGREEQWFRACRDDCHPIHVPWILESVFPDYDGVVWYYRKVEIPEQPHRDGRTLLRFWAVDFQADVWVNGTLLGSHTGGETPFVLDATAAVTPGTENLVAVRVLNPSNTPIDGIRLNMTPRGLKTQPHQVGLAFNHGGILDSVELLLVPAARVTDVFVQADPHSGEMTVDTAVVSAGANPLDGELLVTVAPAQSGTTITSVRLPVTLQPGDTTVRTRLRIDHPRRWALNDPFLYRVTVRLTTAAYPASYDEASVRTGFREFVFRDGYFRLNGKRIFLRCSHTCNHAPIGLRMAHDPDLFRRDLINAKMMGFNAIRFIAGLPTRYQLELADELGLMVYEECQAAWMTMEVTPHFAEWFDSAVREMILRDRNHPSVVIWGLLNECASDEVNRHAATALPLVRSLDPTRLVFFNSGRWDLRAAGAAGFPDGIACTRRSGQLEPFVALNRTEQTIRVLGIVWEPGVLATHPGPLGEYGVVRWTAPDDSACTISAVFEDITEQTTTTDVHVLHNGRTLFAGGVNVLGGGDRATFEGTVQVRTGDTLDFAVGRGNGNYGGDTTRVDIRIRTAAREYHAAREFVPEPSAQSPWSYGMYAAADAPRAETFVALADLAEAPLAAGTFCNPGSTQWDSSLDDHHPYRRVPHTADIIEFLRTVGQKPYDLVNSRGGGRPYFPSEYGIGSGVNWPRVLRLFEQHGSPQTPDRAFYQAQYDRYLADYERWNMAELFGHPEAFFRASLARMAGQRTLGFNALRSNPAVVGYSLTGTVDQVMGGEGLWTTFRELKPGTADAVFDGWAPLRWCCFVEPLSQYAGGDVTLDVVLANEDVLPAGQYPAKAWVFGPDAQPVFEASFNVVVGEGEQPFALPAFHHRLAVDGPTGTYRLVVSFERGAAATGGEVEFYLFDRRDMPRVEAGVVLWGDDPELAQWLAGQGISVAAFDPTVPVTTRQLLLASRTPPAPGGDSVFADLVTRIEHGSHVIFLCPEVFRSGNDTTTHLPLAERGRIGQPQEWLYHVDQWAKRHPVFEGLPAGGLLDYGYYRELIPESFFVGVQTPDTAIAGGNNASLQYEAGLMLAQYRRGQGGFLINTLLIREHLGKVPQAERLLRNMLRAALSFNPPPQARRR